MAKMIILYDDIFLDKSSFSATSEASGYEKEYLEDPNPANLWRSTVITESIIKVDMGAAVEIEGACMINHNLVAGDTTIKFEADAADFAGAADETDDFTLKTFDVKGTTKRNAFVMGNWTYRYYQWRLQKAAGTYIEFANPFLFAKKYEFVKSEKMDYFKGREKISIRNLTKGGQIIKSRKYSRLVYNFECYAISTAQKDALEAIGEYDHVCILPENIAGTEFHFGTIEFSVPQRIEYKSELWQMSGNFIESAF